MVLLIISDLRWAQAERLTVASVDRVWNLGNVIDPRVLSPVGTQCVIPAVTIWCLIRCGLYRWW